MIRPAKFLALAGFAAVLATGAFAQQQPQAPAKLPEFPKEHLASARAAIDASKVTEGFDTVLIGIAQQTKALFQRSNPALTDVIEQTTNKAAIELAPRRVELDRLIQTAWASKFSKEELDEIAKFYNSPIGKKLATETQTMVQFATEVGDGLAAEDRRPDMVEKVRTDLQKAGHKL